MDAIKKETYLRAKADTQREMIFDIVSAVNLKTEENGETISNLGKSFQERKIKDRSFAGMMGFFGGFVASFARGFFK